MNIEIKNFDNKGCEQIDLRDIPTIKEEAWRYTNLTPATRQTYTLSQRLEEVDLGAIGNYYSLQDINVVFVNGILSTELSNFQVASENFQIIPFPNALKNNTITLNDFGLKFDSTQNPFVRLNDELLKEGVSIRIKSEKKCEPLIHIIHITVPTDSPSFFAPRIIINVEKSSESTILESHLSVDKKVCYFAIPLTDIFLEDSATLHYCKIQKESLEAFHIGTTRVWQERDTVFEGFSFMHGGAIARNNLDIILTGQGGDTTLNGLYCAKGHQHMDNHTSVEHRVPHCNSHQLYKGILNNTARAVFNGKVVVRPEAQQTNSYQLNKNLLLGKDCRVDTKPQLEIFADDVKCSHGATIGQLNEDEIFYLQTRCIKRQNAIGMLSRGFIDEVLETIKSQSIQEKLRCQMPCQI